MLSARSQNDHSQSQVEVSARNSLMPGKISIVQMIDSLATQKKLNSLKLSGRVTESKTQLDNSVKKEITGQGSARVSIGGHVGLKIRTNELNNLAQDISGRYNSYYRGF